MKKPKNHNLFAGDKAYQTNRFLTFRSMSTEEKFQADTFLRTKYFLQGYILICLLYVIFNTLSSDCFNFYHSCRHNVLLIWAIISLVSSYIPVKMKNAILVRIFLLIPSLYIHLLTLENNTYSLAVYLIVIQTTITSGLTLSTWKSHAFYTLIAYGLLSYSLKYYDAEFLVQGCVASFFQDLLIYTLIPLTLVAYIEKGRRERWVLLETFKRSERSFMMLVEKIKSPVFILNNSKRIVFANQKALDILKKYFPNTSAKVPINKLNLDFTSLLTSASKLIFETTLQEAGLEEGSLKTISLKDPESMNQENPNQKNDTNVLELKIEELIEDSNNIFELTCVRTLWKNSHSYLVSIQDITNPVKVQTSVSNSYIQIIHNIRDQIESAQTVFESMMNLNVQNQAQRPLLQAISNMDTLQYSVLNTSAVFDISRDKFRTENDIFDLRETIVYMLEILSIRTIKQKIEMSLKFEGGFPDQVTGDCFRFTQIFHNLLTTVIESSKDSRVEIFCNVKTVLTSQGKFLLEFIIECPENEGLKFEELAAILNGEDPCDCSVEILKKSEKEIKLNLLKPLLKELSGEVKVTKKQHLLELKFELPIDNADPSPSHKSSRKVWRLPILAKFNLTNTKTKNSKNSYTWSALPLPPSTDLQLSDTQSPFIMKEKLSERIKLQFNDSQSSSSSTSIQQLNTNLKSQAKTPNYEEFKKNKMNLMKFVGKDADNQALSRSDQTDEEGASRRESRDFDKSLTEKPEVKIDTKSLPSTTFHLHEVARSPKEAFRETNRLGQNDTIALNIKRQKSVRDKQEHAEAHPKEEKKPLEMIREESKSELKEKEEKEKTKKGKRNSKGDPQIRIEEASPRKEPNLSQSQEENQGFLKTSDIDLESLHRGINRVKKGKRKSKSISNRNLKSDSDEHGDKEKEKEIEKPKGSPYKPLRPSYFSPISPQNEMLEIPTDESMKASSEDRKGSSNSEVVEEDTYGITRNRLKINENNLKIAVGNILLGILTLYGAKKRSSAVTSHSKLSEKDEKKIDEPRKSTTNLKEEMKNHDHLANGEEDKEVERVVKESIKNGGLNAHEFLERIIELLASRIVIEKNEKEFMTFLGHYVKQIEKILQHHDFRAYNRGSMNSLDDEEEKVEERVVFASHFGGPPLPEDFQRHGYRSMFIPKRKNSDDSIYSLNSEIGEKNLNLAERMLVPPSVMVLLRDRGHSRAFNKKKFSTPGDLSEDESFMDSGKKTVGGAGSPTNLGESNNFTTKMTEGQEELSQLKADLKSSLLSKEERAKEIVPFNYPMMELPAFITVRIETQIRRWLGGQIRLQEQEQKQFIYLEDFTILVVDDNPYVFKGLELATCPYKKSLDYAKNGLEGFSKYKSMLEKGSLYHIILMDVLMPTCDGLEATKMIRDYEVANKCPRTFVCAVSSFEDEATRRKCRDAGMDDYCCKPIGTQILSQLILSRCQSLGIVPSLEE